MIARISNSYCMLSISIPYIHCRPAYSFNELPMLLASNLDVDFERRNPMFRNIHIQRIDFIRRVLDEVEAV